MLSQIKEHQGFPESGRDKKGLSPWDWSEYDSAANILILNLHSPELRENKFLLF